MRLIEAREGPETYSRAMAVQARSLELLEKMGVLPAFLAAGKHAQHFTFHWKTESLDFSLKDLDTPYPFSLLIAQSETEKILTEHLRSNGLNVEWKTRLLNLDKGSALIELPSGEKEEKSYSWIIGCDGGHSTVRSLLRLPFTGKKLHEVFLLADLEAQTDTPIEGPQTFLSHKGFGLLIPFPKENLFRIVLPGAEPTDSPSQMTQLIQERGFSYPFEVSKIEMVSTFTIQERHVLQYRIGNIFLAGDAAHVHSPFGGQGMNTGMQDAFNLAWKLALVIQNAAPDTLLDSYEKERLPVAKRLLKETTRMTRLLTFSQNRFPALYYWAMRLLNSTKKGREKAVHLISELALSYPMPSPEDKGWEGPRPGQRAPDAQEENGIRVFDYLKSPNCVLLLFSENLPVQKAVEQEYGKWVEVRVVEGKMARQKYAAETTSLYLVRPDGYIAFRSRKGESEEILTYLSNFLKPALLHSKG